MALAVHIDPLQDELLSSWVMRSCHANATSFYSLLWHYGFNSFAQIDIDQSNNSLLLQWIADIFEHPYGLNGTVRMGLLPIHDLEKEFPHKSWLKGIDRRAYKWRSFLFCPLCLQQDDFKYFRRHWRLEWHEVCPIHKTLMPNGCTKCGAPIILHRIKWESSHLAHCYSCRIDFTSIQSTPVTISDLDLSAIKGLYRLIMMQNPTDYSAVHFLEAVIEQGVRSKGMDAALNSLTEVGLTCSKRLAAGHPSLFLAISAYQLWFKNRGSLNDYILTNQGWFNLAARDYGCPDIMKPFHHPHFKEHEINEKIIRRAIEELMDKGIEPNSSNICRIIGCHVNRVAKFSWRNFL